MTPADKAPTSPESALDLDALEKDVRDHIGLTNEESLALIAYARRLEARVAELEAERKPLPTDSAEFIKGFNSGFNRCKRISERIGRERDFWKKQTSETEGHLNVSEANSLAIKAERDEWRTRAEAAENPQADSMNDSVIVQRLRAWHDHKENIDRLQTNVAAVSQQSQIMGDTK